MVTPRKETRELEAAEWLTVHDVARLLDVSASTVRAWVDDGLVVHTLGPRTIRVGRAELDRFLATRRSDIGPKTFAADVTPAAEAVG